MPWCLQVTVVDTSNVQVVYPTATTASTQKPPLLAVELQVSDGSKITCKTSLDSIVPRMLAVFDKAITVTQVCNAKASHTHVFIVCMHIFATLEGSSSVSNCYCRQFKACNPIWEYTGWVASHHLSVPSLSAGCASNLNKGLEPDSQDLTTFCNSHQSCRLCHGHIALVLMCVKTIRTC